MDIPNKRKSDLYVFAGWVWMLSAVALNPFTVSYWQEAGWFPVMGYKFMHHTDVQLLLPGYWAMTALALGGMVVFAKRHLLWYFNHRAWFNLVLVIILGLFLLSLNVILPGKWKLLRILHILLILFFLTNAFYLAIVKKRRGKPDLHPFYKNLALSGYSLVLILLLLEIVFMFFRSTHRFNGTLASRAWFIRYYELNEEGYRDRPLDKASLEGKRLVMALGDSFTEGHGIRNPEDRYGDLLEQKLGDDVRVVNMGKGGSDVADALHRLKSFDYQPDLIVFNYYPNDIESDGKAAGLNMPVARSYHDLIAPLRFVVRRSYLLNYIYWQYPHPDELSDYFGYLRQCYTNEKVLDIHHRHIRELTAYADSISAPLIAVVIPFLEDVKGSDFACQPAVSYFRSLGVPTIDMRIPLRDKPVEDIVVNMNDAHANEAVQAIIADSVYGVIQRIGWQP